MSIRVLIVDDSVILRGLLYQLLEQLPEVSVVATAASGVEAIECAARCWPDMVLLDIEMPCMDGLTALPRILKESPESVVIMIASQTISIAKLALQALEWGAADYIVKPAARDSEGLMQFYADVREKVLAMGKVKARPTDGPMVHGNPRVAPAVRVSALALVASTGGPQALLTILGAWKRLSVPVPIFITQHMPATFSTLFADQITQESHLPCAEGQEGMLVQAGRVYLAPGGFHMTAYRCAQQVVIGVNEGPPVHFCRPAADPMLQSLARVYGAGLLSVICTGMGEDGLEGARSAVAHGGRILAQDQHTSAVYGMPKAVADAGLCEAVLPLERIAEYVRAQW